MIEATTGCDSTGNVDVWKAEKVCLRRKLQPLALPSAGAPVAAAVALEHVAVTYGTKDEHETGNPFSLFLKAF